MGSASGWTRHATGYDTAEIGPLVQGPVRSRLGQAAQDFVFNSIVLLASERLFLMTRLVAWSGSTILGRLIYVFIGSFATFAAAWLSWHLPEKHFLKLKRHFSSDRVPERSDRPDLFAGVPTGNPQPDETRRVGSSHRPV